MSQLKPPAIGLDVYKKLAQEDETYYTSVDEFEDEYDAGLLSANDVVVYVEDPTEEVHIQNGALRGTLVVVGGIDMNNVQIRRGSASPYDSTLVLYVGGNLKMSGGNSIEGLVYVEGVSTFSGGNNTIFGSLFSVSTSSPVNVAGSVTVTYDPLLGGELQASPMSLHGLLNTGLYVYDWTQM